MFSFQKLQNLLLHNERKNAEQLQYYYFKDVFNNLILHFHLDFQMGTHIAVYELILEVLLDDNASRQNPKRHIQ